tara:strand:+ start:47001 stop:47849 length:849 start_codon:yes stop_codon:yes gene_type:complete
MNKYNKHNSSESKNSGHRAKKHFGQNFLIDDYYINCIINSLNAQKEDYILEVGPGLGALTKHIINDCKSFSAIEIDKDLIENLNKKFPSINLYNIDILKFDFEDFFKKVNQDNINNQIHNKIKVIGNLPYNISTELLFKFFDNIEYISEMHIMLQQEVVDRIIAKPNTKAYGKLSIISQYFCDIEEVVTIPPEAFQPAPKIFSKFIKLTPFAKKHNIDKVKLLNKIASSAFHMRRKVINNNLKQLLSLQEFEQLEINPKLRAEDLTLDDFLKITEYIWQRTQ